MKTWKIVGITGLMLVSLLWSGVAQAKRFDKHSYQTQCQNQVNYPPYGHHPDPRWVAERQRERLWQERQQQRHHHWQRYHDRMARSSHWR